MEARKRHRFEMTIFKTNCKANDAITAPENQVIRSKKQKLGISKQRRKEILMRSFCSTRLIPL